jgi:hypothetical protein
MWVWVLFSEKNPMPTTHASTVISIIRYQNFKNVTDLNKKSGGCKF